jgi:hypothetical protein
VRLEPGEYVLEADGSSARISAIASAASGAPPSTARWRRTRRACWPIGGGAYYFAPLLREMLPHLAVPRHAEVANAQGYLAIGQQLPERMWARLRP